MKNIMFDIEGQPPIMRRNRGKPGQRPYPTKAQKLDYERIRGAYTDKYEPLQSDRAFAIGVNVHYGRDVDLGHVLAAVEDSLQGLTWKNDRQIQSYLPSSKGRAVGVEPCVRVWIQELEHVYRS
jgi:hypothetical protein